MDNQIKLLCVAEVILLTNFKHSVKILTKYMKLISNAFVKEVFE